MWSVKPVKKMNKRIQKKMKLITCEKSNGRYVMIECRYIIL